MRSYAELRQAKSRVPKGPANHQKQCAAVRGLRGITLRFDQTSVAGWPCFGVSSIPDFLSMLDADDESVEGPRHLSSGDNLEGRAGDDMSDSLPVPEYYSPTSVAEPVAQHDDALFADDPVSLADDVASAAGSVASISGVSANSARTPRNSSGQFRARDQSVSKTGAPAPKRRKGDDVLFPGRREDRSKRDRRLVAQLMHQGKTAVAKLRVEAALEELQRTIWAGRLA